ncbi:MAG: SDR family NAD(P)-dependent oxidoreductase [Coriobacteriia bacterium]|nr:SDR family NAD(P)-dependent oxidoreductase [Coriobacteriia bacterium]
MDLTGKRVLVTGADGFVGSHLTQLLVREGVNVRAFVYYNSFNSWGWLDSVSADERNALDVFAGDIRDPNGVRAAMKGVDVVFHLAALIGIPFSYHSPDSYVDTNIKGTLNVLQAARDVELERVVVTSTSEVYGTAQYVPIDEGHPRKGQSPYSASKIGADAMAESFYRSFGLPVTIVRPFNTYGPRQSARAVIPTIIIQLMSGVEELHLGSLHPTRDLTYVSDCCDGFVSLAASDEAVGRDVNLGVGQEISIGELAALLMDVIGHEVPIVSQDERQRPARSEVERLLSDNSLARSLTGWTPRVPLREGLERTVEWFADPSNRCGYKFGYTV